MTELTWVDHWKCSLFLPVVLDQMIRVILAMQWERVGISKPKWVQLWKTWTNHMLSFLLPAFGVLPVMGRTQLWLRNRANFILKDFRTQDAAILFKLFASYVRPILESRSPIWFRAKASQVDEIQKLQRSFTYRCFARKVEFKISNHDRLKKLGVLTLKERSLVADLLSCIFFMRKLTTSGMDLKILLVKSAVPGAYWTELKSVCLLWNSERMRANFRP